MAVDLPVLIVHRCGEDRESIAEVLAEAGHAIRVASDWTSALCIYEAEHPWLVVSDLGVGSREAKPFADAIAFRGATKLFCVTPVPTDPREITKAVRAGATELFELPRDLAELASVAGALAKSEPAARPQFASDRPATLEGVRVQARLEQRRRLAEALRQHEGNISRVAKRLGCSRQAVYDRMKRLGLKKEDYVRGSEATPPHTQWSTNGARLKVLVVEDQEPRRNEIGACLKDAGFEVQLASDCQEGWECVQHTPFDCVVTDFKTPRMSGLELIEHIRESGSRVPIILLTAYQETALTVAAMKRGAQSVFNYDKSLEWSDLIREIADQVASHRSWTQAASGR